MSWQKRIVPWLVFMLLVIIFTQAIMVWLSSGNTIPVQVAAWSTFSDDSSGLPLGAVQLTGGCETSGAGGCPE